MKERVSMNFIKQDQKNVSMSTCVCGCLPRPMLTGDGRNSYILEQAWTPGFLLSVTLLSFFPIVITGQDCVLVLRGSKERESQGDCSMQLAGLRKRNPERLESAASKRRREGFEYLDESFSKCSLLTTS